VSRLRFAAPFTVAAIVAVACSHSPAEPTRSSVTGQVGGPITFKVATWNIRSGMGIRGFATTSWSSDTINCTDTSKPVNAWGIGLPQMELARIRADQSIVAFAVQEAWNCGSPTNINSVLGFKDVSREQNGTALLARYGFAAAPTYTKISGEDWLVGGPLCLNAVCSVTLPVFSTHWSAPNDEFGGIAQQTVAALRNQPTPQLVMGDFNVYRTDAWNPSVPCTGADVAGRLQGIDTMERAGYADAWKATQSSEGWTGMATRNGCGIPNGNLFKRIDYVYSRDLQAISTTRIARAAPGADSPSDHVALIAELRRQ
jgi:endonuclease/exonuclease/phosphatase family metal-dependent hydrolase